MASVWLEPWLCRAEELTGRASTRGGRANREGEHTGPVQLSVLSTKDCIGGNGTGAAAGRESPKTNKGAVRKASL